MSKSEHKILSTTTLKKVLTESRAKGFNCVPPEEFDAKIDPAQFHVLSKPLLHGDGQCIRCTLCLVGMLGRPSEWEGMIDVDVATFNNLPDRDLELVERERKRALGKPG